MEEILHNLLWIEELLPVEVEPTPKNGGVGYYLDTKLVLILVEQPRGVYEHKGVSYPFELWNGCILPIEQIKQNAFFLKFSFLENHPANKNWLYIPADSDDFEDQVKQFLVEIRKRNPLLGIPVKFATPRKSEPTEPGAKKKVHKKKIISKKEENAFFINLMNSRNKKATPKE